MEDIFDHPEKYHLTAPEGNVLSYIIGSHSRNDVFDDAPEIYPVGNEDVHVKLLSALFRLSDVLHTDNSRVPHINVSDSKKEDDKTRLREIITGWTIKNDRQIELKSVPIDSNDLNIIAKGVSMMQKEIDFVAPVLRSEKYPSELIYSCDNRGITKVLKKENKRKILEMDYYTEDDESIFHGREIEAEDVFRMVVGSNISLLVGNSGVGKTSLIRAGLFPKLTKMNWTCIWTRPTNPAPIDHILRDIHSKLPDGYVSSDIISGLKALSEQSDAVIVIDQFEDILRQPQPIIDIIENLLLRIDTNSFKNIHILLAYRGDFEPEISSLLRKSGIKNPTRFPLLDLDVIGARKALKNIFQINNIGIKEEVLDKIINELTLESKNGRFYPPDLQIAASSLINLAKTNGGVITEELYSKNVGTINRIIADYLMNQLNDFGNSDSSKRKSVEAILKELVRKGVKEQKGKDELLRYLNIPDQELQEMLDSLVDKRLIRRLDSDNFEIIHDYLASKVEEIIKDEERPLRSARDILKTKALSYQYLPTPSLLLPNEMALLYSMRLSINPTIQEKELLMFSYLAGNGPALSWFKDDKETVKTIIIKALSNKLPDVRTAAVSAFEKLVNHSDLPIIIELIRNPDPDVRKVVASALEKFGTKSDLPTITELFKDTNPDVRKVAVSAFEKLVNHSDLQMIIELLKNPDSEVRKAAVSAFEKLVNHSDLQMIIELLKNPDSEVRKAAVSAFEKLVTHSDFQIIIELLKNPDSEVRKAAVSAFEKFGKEGDLLIIKDLLEDPDIDIKEMAVLAFRKLAIRSSLPTIIELFKDTNSEVRKAAVSAFEKLVTHSDLPIIKELLKNPDSEVRKAAVSAFEKFCTQDDLHVIKALLKDPEWSVRKIAVKALLKIGSEADFPIIREMLEDSDLSVSEIAVSAFIKFVTKTNTKEIKKMLNSSNSNVRKAAVFAFEKIGTQTDLPIIKEMLKDPDPDVRKAVVSAFEKFGTQTDLSVIKEMLKDPDPDVRKQ